ncbi:histidinol-phosphate aminotransferase family protein [Motilibacter sp. K478]|nr:histidinol-phosphate transaminase [Motilibacter aurantiacus]NHC45715.1 histidinol-phosphate aminotransferase family protein [Motilibacter aurantiacus]
MGLERVRVGYASAGQREAAYRLRHAAYARELGQHPENAEQRLTDRLDASNAYLVATVGEELVGSVSVTAPGGALSLDTYVSRGQLPFPVDERVHEVRLLTVAPGHRGGALAALLMYAAFRHVEAAGGTRIVGMGHGRALAAYRQAGARPLGLRVTSGALGFEVFTMTTTEARARAVAVAPLLARLRACDWRLPFPFTEPAGCFHGGASFDGVGERFDALERSTQVVNADVLDAWFPPAPGAVEAVAAHLPWLLRTSPPTECGGLLDTVAEARGVPRDALLPGAGSSALIFLAFGRWLTPASRVLLLDPTYGEYAHVLEHVVRCRVDRLRLEREEGYGLDVERLVRRVHDAAYDLVVLVNPNSPTGRHVPRPELTASLRRLPGRARVWVDETYVDFAGPDESLERYAAASRNVVVCKSMSKAYALSGARVAYLCGPAAVVAELRAWSPPWAVSLPGQVAAVRALQDPGYYAARWAETAVLRTGLAHGLRALGLDVVPGAAAGFLLAHLPGDGPDAQAVVDACRAEEVYLRDAGAMGTALGAHALRIAVRTAPENARALAALTRALHGHSRMP